jgi:hypothetical protein
MMGTKLNKNRENLVIGGISMEKIKEAAFDLDGNLSSINSQVEVMFGAKDLLHDVKEVLAEALMQGDSMIPITAIHGKLLAIHELIRFSLDGIYTSCEDAEENKDVLFAHFAQETSNL